MDEPSQPRDSATFPDARPRRGDTYIRGSAEGSDPNLIDRLCADQLGRWRAGHRATAESYLDRHPELGDDPEAFFELIYGEFLVRESLGEVPTSSEFLGRFPRYADRLARQFELHRALQDDEGPPTDADASLDPVPAPGPEFPGFELLGELGRGAMGVVYRARQLALNRVVALKVIRPALYADPGVAARFRAEAEMAARFHHSHIIQVFEVGEHDGRGYLALEYAAGGSLQQQIAAGPLAPREAAALVESLARAAHYAHAQGVVHRDLKPANVVLTADGTPKLTDFGLAKLMERDGGLTRTGDILGTPSYMAPEQARGEPGAVGAATDVYALGSILYAALTGRPPFQAETPLSTLDLVARHDPLPPGRLQRHTPRDLETICLKCLEKEPRRRYTSAEALADDLRQFLDGRPIRARRISRAGRAAKWARREPAKAALVTALLLAIGGGFVGMATLWRRAERKAVAELAERRRASKAEVGARDNVYVSQIARAQLEWRANAVDRVDSILDRCDPGRRGWEWGYLRNINHSELLSHEDIGYPEATAVAFSPDGRLLAALAINPFNNPVGDPALADARVLVFDAADGRRLRTFDAPTAACRLSFQPGGQLLAASGAGGEVFLWDLKDGREIRRWKPGGTVAFSRNGRTIVAGGGDAVTVWSADDFRQVARLESTGGRATPAPEGDLLAVSGREAVTLRRSLGGSVIATLPHGAWDPRAGYFPSEGPALAFSPDGRRLVVATSPPRIWDVETARALHDLVGHDGAVLDVAFSPDGRTAATAGRDATIRLWDVQTGIERAIIRGHAERAACLAFHPDGWALASGGRKLGDFKVWDLTRSPEYAALPHAHAPAAIGFEPKGGLCIVRRSGLVERWDDARGRAELGGFADLSPRFLSPARLADLDARAGRLATLGAGGRTVAVRDLTTGRERSLQVPDAARSAAYVAISRDGRRVGVADLRKFEEEPNHVGMTVWDADTGAVVATWEPGRYPVPYSQGSLAFGPDAEEVAYVDYDETTGIVPGSVARAFVCVKDLRSGRDRLRLPHTKERIFGLGFSPDGRHLAASDIEGEVAIWDAVDGVEIHRIRPKEHTPIFGFAFSPDGRRLAGADREKTIVWDLATGEELIALRIAGRRPSDGGFNPAAAWSPDGRRLSSTNWDGSVSVWDGGEPPSDPARRVALARARGFAWHLTEAEAAAASGQAEAVAFHLGRTRADDPPDRASFLRRAALRLRLGESADADITRWIAADEPDEGLGWLTAARVLLRRGDLAGQGRLRSRCLTRLEPPSHQAITWQAVRALVLAPAPRGEAEAVLRAARAIPPSGKQASRTEATLALACYRAGLDEEALAHARSAAKDASQVPLLACLQVLVHRRRSELDDARRLLAEAEHHLSAANAQAGLANEEWPDFLILLAEARSAR